MCSSMQLKKPATVESYESDQPNAFAPIDPALGRLLPLSPTAQLAQIPVCAGLTDKDQERPRRTKILFGSVKPRAFPRLLRCDVEVSNEV